MREEFQHPSLIKLIRMWFWRFLFDWTYGCFVGLHFSRAEERMNEFLLSALIATSIKRSAEENLKKKELLRSTLTDGILVINFVSRILLLTMIIADRCIQQKPKANPRQIKLYLLPLSVLSALCSKTFLVHLVISIEKKESGNNFALGARNRNIWTILKN